ncbi:MAG TPA: hypothetical protein VEV81_11825, partial [Pyrinomonadaceae bacterium]|nr:hypothetical protein [Pyrinomonadaceae bacterium]
GEQQGRREAGEAIIHGESLQKKLNVNTGAVKRSRSLSGEASLTHLSLTFTRFRVRGQTISNQVEEGPSDASSVVRV